MKLEHTCTNFVASQDLRSTILTLRGDLECTSESTSAATNKQRNQHARTSEGNAGMMVQ